MSQPEDAAAPSLAQELPPDRELEGFKLVGWGLYCTVAWLLIVLITAVIADTIVGDGTHSEVEVGTLVFVISQGAAGLISWCALPRLMVRRGARSVMLMLLSAVISLAVMINTITYANESGLDGASSEAGQLIFVIGQAAAGLIGWLVLPRWIMRRRGRADVVSWRRPTRSDLLWSVGGLVSIYVVLFVYTAIVTSLGADSLVPQSTIDDNDLYLHTSVIIALGVLVIVCAPIYEESFARGFVLGGLRPHWGMIPAFLVSAAVFSALHEDPGSMIPFAIAGLILGLVYVRTDSLTAASMTHFGFNVIGYSATLVQQLA